ncbi:hypothetical protein UlMin_039015 [Ulmus minor]
MGSAKLVLLSSFVVALLSLSLPCSSSVEPENERSLDVAPSAGLQLSRGLLVKNSPGRVGKSVVCERVHIYGLSRIKNLGKFSHSVKVKVSGKNSSTYLPNAEVCFHRNFSLAIGMCSEGQWEKVSKGSWVRPMSPFDHKLLDIRAASSLESFEVSIEEDFFVHRIILLAFGIVMMSMASFLSKSLVFYYGSAMVIGVVLVVTVVLYQATRLVPFGGKKFAIFVPSSIFAFVYFLQQSIPGILQSILAMFGIEEMYDPLVKFLLAFIVLAGAWMGFWVIRKLVLTEEGSIDTSTSYLVAWTIRILAALAILQSSADPLLAMEALLLGIVVSSILRKIFRLRFLRRMYRKLMKSVKTDRKLSQVPYSSASEDSLDDYTYKIGSNADSSLQWCQSRKFTTSPLSPSNQGLNRRTPIRKLESEVYPSSFYDTPDGKIGKRFSKQGWEKFTRESTETALEQLVSSPGFSKWLYKNADRINVTPKSGRAEEAEVQPKRLFWF